MATVPANPASTPKRTFLPVLRSLPLCLMSFQSLQIEYGLDSAVRHAPRRFASAAT
jgi:hypothetical protein